uniref:PGG domain-containing protein n=1 Tax=Davidia involucrata TaxID=16924 RepID=A0A5B7A6J5_DAVIN
MDRSSSSSFAQYPYPSMLNVGNFVSIKLSEANNYLLWKTQMLGLIESQDMLGFIDGMNPAPAETITVPHDTREIENQNYLSWRRSDRLLKGWIIGSLSEHILGIVVGLNTARDVWTKLENHFTQVSQEPEIQLVKSEPTQDAQAQHSQRPQVKLEKAETTEEEQIRRLLIGLQEITPRPIPPSNFLAEGRNKDLNEYLPLYKAALKGDWKAANDIFNEDSSKRTARITVFLKTALHVAAGAGHAKFVKNLVDIMPVEALEMQDDNGHTALFFAALAGSTESARAMVMRNPNLTQIKNHGDMAAVLYATLGRGKDVLKYLCSVTRDEDPSPFAGAAGGQLLNNIIASGFYDVSLDLLDRYPNLANGGCERGVTPLDVLAQRPAAFPSGNRLCFFQRLIYSFVRVNEYATHEQHVRGDEENGLEGLDNNMVQMPNLIQLLCRGHVSQGIKQVIHLLWKFIYAVPCIKQVHDIKLMNCQSIKLLKRICDKISEMESPEILEYFRKANILSTATENGIVEIIIECIQYFPDLMWMRTNDRTIFHMAIEHRREKIFNLIYGLSAHKHVLASFRVGPRNNMLHIAAKLAPSSQLNSVSGAALQMQRELQWYQEVEKIVDPSYKELINLEGKIPRALFSEEHKNLVEKGEKWMKDTTSSCMVVAALIATVVFAAAFTAPGGNDQEKGIPIFLKARSFVVFIISDAIALFSSSTSVLMFLAILTARYAEDDFLESLPKKLIIGLASLFISIAAMVTAFSATLFIVLGQRESWFVIPIVLLACLPVTSFALLQFPLFIQIFRSTFGSGIFNRQSKNSIY